MMLDDPVTGIVIGAPNILQLKLLKLMPPGIPPWHLLHNFSICCLQHVKLHKLDWGDDANTFCKDQLGYGTPPERYE